MCKKSHHDCKTQAKSFFPNRVIALGTYDPDALAYQAWLESDVKLHESTGTHSAYAALSHCWGITQPLRLLKRNLEQFKSKIEFSTLRNTFRHAIVYARKLGIPYLWIDSLVRFFVHDSGTATLIALYSVSFRTIYMTGIHSPE
jgi:hypothetical protein